jgi:hypothetical protein
MNNVALEIDAMPGRTDGVQPSWIVFLCILKDPYVIAFDELRSRRTREGLVSDLPNELGLSSLLRLKRS